MRKRVIAAIFFFLGAWMAVGAYGASTGAPAKTHPAATEKPNFIIINTDDLDFKSVELLPKIKALLTDHGTTFANNFVTYSLCCPSRSSLLRGQYPHNHQIFSNFYPEGGFEKFHELGNEQSTVATWLKSAGYRTMLAGKYLNGYPGKLAPSYVPPGWDEWYALIGHHYAYYNYQLSENGRAVTYGDKPKDYETDVLAARTIDFIVRASQNRNQPFFIYLAPSAPHLPATPAPKYAGAFPNATAPRPESFNADVKGKPAWMHKKPLTPEEIGEIDQMYRKRLQSMLSVDDMVAEIVQELEKHGQLHNTYIFFTSDNGFHLGEHRLREGKSTAYEEDIRVPLIVRGPGVAAHIVLSEMSLNIDLAPTLADLAGVAIPDFVDGRSLKPLLHSAPLGAPWRHDFFVQYKTKSHRNMPSFDGLRSTEYLYVEYATGEKELYDVREDPLEMHNLARTSSPELLAELSKRLADLKHCAGDACRRESRDALL